MMLSIFLIVGLLIITTNASKNAFKLKNSEPYYTLL
jgi:hypothetical protein